MDIDDPQSIKTAAQEIENTLDGRGLDYLINNAGRVNRIMLFPVLVY